MNPNTGSYYHGLKCNRSAGGECFLVTQRRSLPQLLMAEPGTFPCRSAMQHDASQAKIGGGWGLRLFGFAVADSRPLPLPSI